MTSVVVRLQQTWKGKLQVLFSTKYLLYTNTGISLFMSCLGDGLQQRYQITRKEIDTWNMNRSRNVGFTGLAVGPFCHYWYLYLDKWLPGRSARIVMKKLVVDQLICSPIVISGFLIATSVLDGLNWSDTKQELVQKGKTLYKAEWLVWPPAQIINFAYLPTKYRVLFDNAVSFGFDWYFSYVKYGDHHKIHHDRTNVITTSPVFSDYDSSVHFCGTGSHIPFVHLQAAKEIHCQNYVQYLKDVDESSDTLEEAEGNCDIVSSSKDKHSDLQEAELT